MKTILDKITLLIPCYNEQEVLEQLWLRLNTILGEISAVSFEILFVNDGSTDTTLHVIKKLAAQHPQISYLDLSRNFGKELAMITPTAMPLLLWMLTYNILRNSFLK